MTINRDELYARVWNEPFVSLARKLGYTYVELVRVCTKMAIPRPTGGYWHRLAQGGASEQLPLPSPPPGQSTEIPLGNRTQPADAVPADELMENDGVAPDADKTFPAAPTMIDKTAKDSPSAHPERAPANPERPSSVEFTREELYMALWSKPCVKLAAELGISDVGLAKACRRLNVPRPPRGYWARVEAGEKPKREPLPKALPEQCRMIAFCVADNLVRREKWAKNNILTAGRGAKNEAVQLPPESNVLHPIAVRHRQALEKSKPGDLGFVSIHGKSLFSCEMSTALVPRFARALHALVCELEDRDYEFRSGSEEFQGLQISRDADRAGLSWTEAKFEIERETTVAEKRRPSWTWQLRETRAGEKLSIEIHAVGLKGKRKWTEDDGRSLEEVLGLIVEKVEAVFRGYEDRRQRAVEWARQCEEEAKRSAELRAEEAKRQAKEAVEKKERERIKLHETKLNEIISVRRENLASAAQDWIEVQDMLRCVDFCEKRWRHAEGGELTKEQADWLTWAKAEAAKMGPFGQGYPDPALDGSFESGAIPVGGPYPTFRA